MLPLIQFQYNTVNTDRENKANTIKMIEIHVKIMLDICCSTRK